MCRPCYTCCSLCICLLVNKVMGESGYSVQFKRRPATLSFQCQYLQKAVLSNSDVSTPLTFPSLSLPPRRTLGGLSSSPHPSSSSAEELSSPLPLSPAMCNPPTLFPETWLPMATSQDFLQVPVSREDRSYRTVYSLFHKTVSETKFRILKILRVQNPFLWEKYKRSVPVPPGLAALQRQSQQCGRSPNTFRTRCVPVVVALVSGELA